MAGEDSDLVAKKVKVALDAGLKVMFAIGEKKEERESGITMDVCAAQVRCEYVIIYTIPTFNYFYLF